MGNTQLNICWWHSSPPPLSPLLCCVSSKWNYDNFHTGDNQLEREHRLQHTTNFFFHVSINWKLEVKYSISFYLPFLTLFISSVYSIQKCQWADDHHQVMRTSAGTMAMLVSRCLASVDIFAGLSFRWRGHCSVDTGDVDTENMITPLSINTGLALVNIGHTGDKCHTVPARSWLALITSTL